VKSHWIARVAREGSGQSEIKITEGNAEVWGSALEADA